MLHFRRRSSSWAACLAASSLLLSAAVSWSASAAVDHEALLRDRLTEVRELLQRRHAHRHMLNTQVETWSSELDQLQLKRKEALTTLSERIDQTRRYEAELDRLIPKILPRLNILKQLRKEGARTIADMAKIGRASNVNAQTKARFFATKTVSIDQMRRASTSVRLLRRLPNELIGEHRDLDFQIPLLEAAVDRVSNQQEHLQRRRDRAIRHVADLSVDIERLTAEEHRLARNMLARSLTATSRSSTDRVATRKLALDRRNIGKADVGKADVKGTAFSPSPRRAAVLPLDIVPGRSTPSAKSLAPAAPGQTATGKASALVAGWVDQNARDRLESGPVFDKNQEVAALQAEPLSSVSSRVARGQIQESHPLVPTGATIGYTLADVIRRGDQPAIEIPAAPWQRVAAPDHGVVVFANEFRSYGLLLIIEHDSEYHTLLWGFSSLDIELGDRVRAGQIVGAVGTGQSPKLHVELRRNGEPVSPEGWLAASNSGVEG